MSGNHDATRVAERPLPLSQSMKRTFAHWLQEHIPSAYTGMWTAMTARGDGSIPWAPLRKPLAQARVALVTTGGVHRRDDVPFDVTLGSGDPSYRVIPGDAAPEDLMVTHIFYDHTDVDADIGIMFPLEELRRLAGEGRIGAVAPRHFGWMGSITDVRPLVERYAPEAARVLLADGVDAAILSGG